MSNETVWTPERVELLREMRRDGASRKECAAALGVHEFVVKKFLAMNMHNLGEAACQYRYNDIRRRGNTHARAVAVLGLTATEGAKFEAALLRRDKLSQDVSTPKFARDDEHVARCMGAGGFPHFPTDGRGNLVPVWMWPTSRAA